MTIEAHIAAQTEIVLVTRVCVRDASHRRLLAARTATESTEARASWFRKRATGFLRTTVPGVAAQTERPAAWLLLFDALLEDAVAPAYSDALASGLAEIVTIEPPSPSGASGRIDFRYYVPALAAAIDCRLPSSCTRVATIGLDSDDALPRDFVAQLRRQLTSHAHAPLPLVINFPHGFVHNGKSLTQRHIRSSMFAALIEDRARLRSSPRDSTIYQLSHNLLHEIATVVDVQTSEAMWLKFSTPSSIALRNDFADEALGDYVVPCSSEWDRFAAVRGALLDAAGVCIQASAGLRQCGQLDTATVAAAAHCAQHPDRPEMHQEHALALALQGRWEAAIEAQERAEALSPGWARARNGLVEALLSSGCFDAARRLDDGSSDRAVAIGIAAPCPLDDVELAGAIETCPDWPWPRVRAARRALDDGEPMAALDLLGPLLGDPVCAPGRLLGARALHASGREDEALALCRDADLADPLAGHLHALRAELALAQGLHEECLEAVLNASCSWSVGTPPVALERMAHAALLRLGRTAEANVVLVNLLHRKPTVVCDLACGVSRELGRGNGMTA